MTRFEWSAGRNRIVFVLLAAMFGAAAPAMAEQRLVRVIWDVGERLVYYKTYAHVQVGHDAFAVPADAAKAIADGFAPGIRVLRKGDRVRLYVVNYNPVSHVWHESSTVEQIVREPSPVGPLLNAALLALTGLTKAPTTTLNPFMTTDRGADPARCVQLTQARTMFGKLQDSAGALQAEAAGVVADANTLGLKADARKLAGVPTHPAMWREFKNTDAWNKIRTDPDVFGADFTNRYGEFGKRVQKIDPQVTGVNAALLAFDKVFATEVREIPKECIEDARHLLERRGHVVSFVEEVAGPDSSLRQTIATFEAARTLWSAYLKKLSRQDKADTWTDEAIELVVKDPIKADAVLRVDATFVSPEKTMTERTQQSVVLDVARHFPVLVISSGVAYNAFDFKKLRVVKETVTAADGTVSVKNQFRTIDDTSWDKVVPVWIQSVRVSHWSKVGLYGTFGTTPDRNIFKNAILGGSLIVPRWRTTFTGGAIVARGFEDKDLQPVVAKYSSGGFVLADVTADNLELPPTKWKWSPYVSITFTLAAF